MTWPLEPKSGHRNPFSLQYAFEGSGNISWPQLQLSSNSLPRSFNRPTERFGRGPSQLSSRWVNRALPQAIAKDLAHVVTFVGLTVRGIVH